VHHPDHVIDVGAAEREARGRRLRHDREVLLERVRERQIRDVRARDHDVAGGALRVVDDVFEELPLRPGERAHPV